MSQLNGALLEILVETIGAYGKPVGDINIAITSNRLLWSLSDHIAAEDTINSLGKFLGLFFGVFRRFFRRFSFGNFLLGIF
jgi:hypothetical protein